MIYYKDGEIIIRSVCEEDIVSLFSWRIDKEVNKYDPRPIPNNSEGLLKECKDFCSEFEIQIINKNVEERKYIFFIITDLENQLIGFVNFFSINQLKKQGEMGITIGDKRYWNKGIGYKSIKNSVKFIFENMGIDRIYIETEETNVPSLRLFEKLGFIKCDEYIEEDNSKFIVMEIRKTTLIS